MHLCKRTAYSNRWKGLLCKNKTICKTIYNKVWTNDNVTTSVLYTKDTEDTKMEMCFSCISSGLSAVFNSGIKFLLLFSKFIESTMKLEKCQLEIRKHLILTLELIKLILHGSLQHLFHLYAEMLVCAMGPFHIGGIGCCDQPYADKIILLSACLPGIASGAGNIQSNNAQCWVLKIADVKATFGLIPCSIYTSYFTYRLASLFLCKHLKMGFSSIWVLRPNFQNLFTEWDIIRLQSSIQL